MNVAEQTADFRHLQQKGLIRSGAQAFALVWAPLATIMAAAAALFALLPAVAKLARLGFLVEVGMVGFSTASDDAIPDSAFNVLVG